MQQILPGVSIEVRPEGLITPGQVSISTLGVVGTANRGPVEDPVIVGNAADARAIFGEPGTFDEDNPGDALSLVRALEIAFDNGARDAIAVRVADSAATASFTVQSAGGDCCTLVASSPGTWGNDLGINVTTSDEDAVVSDEEIDGAGPLTLAFTPIVESAQTRVSVRPSGATSTTDFDVLFTGAPNPGEVVIDTAGGGLTFNAADAPAAGDTVIVTYVVASASARVVTLTQGAEEESYLVVSGQDLADQLEDSALAELDDTAANPNIDELPTEFTPDNLVEFFSGGTDGAATANYQLGLDALLQENAHIIVAAGQDNSQVGAGLTSHVIQASSDLNKRERIGVVGSAPDASLDDVLGHTIANERMVFVAPGVRLFDRGTGADVTMPGSYAAALVAGMISGFPINRSLTNKAIPVSGLEETYSTAELRQLVLARVLAIEERLGFRTVKGITTATLTAFSQITTVRIVDFAKAGVRSAANPYIGLLNNSRVRAALQATIDAFLSEMVLSEQLVSYDLNVTATRADEIRGIVRVTMTLRPVFSIDFIKVTMFLE
ncbi:MAG: phage tail sheath C-terminal domain-containing protein [Pseudomonadota bacterium]